MFLKTAVLEDAEERVRLVDGLPAAVEQCEYLQVVCVNLILTCTLLSILESR